MVTPRIKPNIDDVEKQIEGEAHATREKKRRAAGKRGGRPKGSKNKPQPVKSEDVKLLIKTMVEEVVKEQLGAAGKEPIAAPVIKKLGTKTTKDTRAPEQREHHVELLFEGGEDILKVPRQRKELFYYWVNTHPLAQHKAQMDGFTAVVGEAECKHLGYDPRHMLNSRGRIQIFDMELFTQPQTLADRKRAYWNEKTENQLAETRANWEQETLAVGGRFDAVTKQERVIKKGTDSFVDAN